MNLQWIHVNISDVPHSGNVTFSPKNGRFKSFRGAIGTPFLDFLKTIYGHKPFFVGPLTGFQSQGGFRACVLSCLHAIPQIPLWCNTCWLYGGQYGSRAFLVYIPADTSASIGGGLELKPMTVCATYAASTALPTTPILDFWWWLITVLKLTCMGYHMDTMDSSDSHLVQYLPTSCQPTLQPSLFDPLTFSSICGTETYAKVSGTVWQRPQPFEPLWLQQ